MTSDRSSLAAMFEGGAPTHSSRRVALLNRRLRTRLLGESDLPAARLGRYTLLERIGSGGMGAVYLAEDSALGRRVAVKVLHGDVAASVGLLVEEGRALARLRHHNVVEVFDVGVDPAVDSAVFIAMEYVPGLDLGRWLRTEPPRRDIVHAFVEAGRGLAAAHRAGLVHGDFKPSNVLRTDDGRIKVIDFGVARIVDQASITHGGGSSRHAPAGGGTLGYCAPEKLTAGTESRVSDVFSFSVALYEALAGALPFATTDRSTFLTSVRIGPRIPLQRGVPRPIRTALARGMHLDPARRWPDMPSLLAQLERYDAPLRRRGTLWAVAGGLVLAAVVGLGTGGDDAETCSAESAAVRDVWTSARGEAEAAFESAPEAFVVDGGGRVLRNLDRYTEDLAQTRVAVCETATRGTIDPGVARARTRCLQQRQHELERFVETLGDAQGRLDAIAASYDLPSIARCLRAEPVAEVPPELRDEVSAIEAGVDALSALDVSSSVDELARAEALLARARVVSYAPVLIRALTALANVQMTAGDAEAAYDAYEEAYFAAQRETMPVRSAELAAGLVNASATLGRYEEARAWARHARAVAERTADPMIASRVDYAEGVVLLMNDRPHEALPLFETTLRTWTSLRGADHPAVADAHLEVGNTYLAMGEYERALEMLLEARRIHEIALGPRHPDLSTDDNNIGAVQFFLGRPESAERSWTRALAIRAEALGEHHIGQHGTLANLAKLSVTQGKWDEGMDYVERAQRVWEVAGLGDMHPDLVDTLEVQGMIHLELDEPEAARRAFARAIEICDTVYGGVERPSLGPLAGAARAAWAMGDAKATLRHAQRFLDGGGAEFFEPETSTPIVWLQAQALWVTGDHEAARASAQRALEAYQSTDDAEAAQTIAQWLEVHDD